MIKLLKILTLSILLIGCSNQTSNTTKVSSNGINAIHHNIIEIDGCEYIESYGSKTYGITHKGNCKYCKNK